VSLALAYGAALHVNEVVFLKVCDIDSERMILRVEQGKGCRYAFLSLVLLEHLIDWWRFANQQGKMFVDGWLFPGLNPIDHMTSRHLTQVYALHAFKCSFRTKLGIRPRHFTLIMVISYQVLQR
jgi:integrase/recombinase XerD